MFGRQPGVEALERRDLLASYTTPEDTLLVVQDSAYVSAVIQARPLHGTVELTNAGGFAYHPAPNYNGPDRFTYVNATTSSVPTGEPQEVLITVESVNDAPVAEGNHYTAIRNTALVIAAPGILSNDNDVDGQSLKAVEWTRPSHGELTPNENGDGGFKYIAAAGYVGEDYFTYKASDGTATSNEARVSILVKALPDARDDQVSVPQNTATTIAASTLLANDVPVTEFGLTVSLEVGGENDPKHGTVVEKKDDNGKVVGFVYTPVTGYYGPDSFVYRATDATPTLNPLPPAYDVARVWLYVRPVPTAVVANDDSYSGLAGRPLEIGAPGVLKNDYVVFSTTTDPAIGGSTNTTAPLIYPLIARLVADSGPKHGTVTVKPEGGFVYTPNPNENYVGTDTFVYVATLATTAGGTIGDNSLSDTATVTITINPLPDARDDFYSVTQNSVLTVTGKGVLGNDIPVRADFGLTATVERKPEHGDLTLDPTGSFVYTPTSGYVGPDSFVYKATDATPTATLVPGAYDTATVFITVRSTAPIVVARPDVFEIRANTPLTVQSPGVLGNDYVIYVDPVTGTTTNGTLGTPPPLVATLLADPAPPPGLSFNDSGNGGFTYSPPAGFSGEVKFRYQAKLANSTVTGSTTTSPTTASGSDVNQLSPIATVTIIVRALPDARDDQYGVLQNGVLTVPPKGVLANDIPVHDHGLKATLETGSDLGPHHGSVTLNADGSFVYTPTLGYYGPDSFVYRATDVPLAGEPITDAPSDVAKVWIYVRPNPIVVANPDFYSTTVDTPLAVAKPGVLGNDVVLYVDSTISSAGTTTTVANPPLRAVLVGDRPDGLKVELAEDGTFDGSFLYEPPAGFTGEVKFSYQAKYVAQPAGTLTGGAILGDPTSPVDLLAAINYAIANNEHPDITTVTILVRQPEAPPVPVARDDSYVMATNTALGIRAPGVLANDFVRLIEPLSADNTDPNSPTVYPEPLPRPTLYAMLVGGPEPATSGELTLEPNGSFHFEPVANFVGDVTFTYQASLTPPEVDSIPILSNIATVTIHVLPALAHNDTYTTLRDVELNVPDPGVLGNDAGGSDTTHLSAVLMSGPLHGELTLNDDGSFSYVPDPSFVGSDIFVYCAQSPLGPSCIPEGDEEPATGDANTATDPADGVIEPRPENRGNIAVVKIYVRAPQPTVHAYPDRYATPKGEALEVEAPGVLVNDWALVNHDVIATLGERPGDAPLHGTVTFNENGDGGFKYVPEEGFVGEDRFTYKATDLDAAPSTTAGTVNFSYATVVIHVLADSTLPNFLPGGDLRSTDESGEQKVADWATIVTLSGEGKPAFTVTTDQPHLFAALPTIDPTGLLTYTPAPNASGLASVTVVLTDGAAVDGIASTTFTIEIEKLRRLYNALQPCDATGDDEVAPDDALAIINYLNAYDSGAVDGPEGEAGSASTDVDGLIYYDVTGDGFIAPDDALTVINAINADIRAAMEGEAADAIDDSLLALMAEEVAASTLGRRR